MRALVTILCLLLAGCPKRHEPGPEYQQALAAFEEAVVETHDYEYTHERFDQVLAMLRAVPEADREAALSLAKEIEAKRAEAKGRKVEVEKNLAAAVREAQAREAAEQQAREQYEAARVPIGGDAPPSEERAPPPPPPPSPAATGPSDFDRAYEEAKKKRLAQESQARQVKQAQDRAETQKRMQEKLEEKKQQLLNEELDPSKWECDQITRVCKAKVSVSPEEVRDKK